MPTLRALQLLAATVFVLLFTWFLLQPSLPVRTGYKTPWHKATTPPQSSNNITQDLEVLKTVDLPAKFKYQRLCISATEKRGLRRESRIQFPNALFEESASIEISFDRDLNSTPDTQTLLPACAASLRIEVPEFTSHADTSTSALMLGVATTLKRIEGSLPTFSRWLRNTGSPLIVLLVDQSNVDDKHEDIRLVYAQAKALGIDLTLEPYREISEHDSEGLKNFGLARVLHENRRENTRWFGIIDDDTFFLSLPQTFEALAPYDPAKQWYIGTLTEGHTRVSQEGFKAWGGAGFFISPPLMELLTKRFADCIPLDKYFGDILWRDCILEVTSPTVHLTEMLGLNQMDLWQDISGWYEAGWSRILTVHHWKSWHYFPVAVSHLVTDVAGPDALLQRYQFGDRTVFTNGYSIAQYPLGLPDLNLVELTMTEDVDVRRPPELLEFHHSMGRTRPALQLGKEKISWKFRHAVKTTNDVVRQFYVRQAESDDSDVSVIEVDWKHA